MKSKTRFLLGLCLFSVFLISCSSKSETGNSSDAGQKKKVPLVVAAAATRGGISQVLEITGSVEAFRFAKIASPAEGTIQCLSVREGDAVRNGQVLVAIGRKQGAEALASSLKTELDKEDSSMQRTMALVAKGALPGEALEQARSNVERVRAQWVKAKESTFDFTLTAPWKGLVARTLASEGEFVSPRQDLVELYDPTTLVIRAAVPERNAFDVRKGLIARVLLDARPSDTLNAVVNRVSPVLDSRLRTRLIELQVKSSVGMLPGMFARVSIETRRIDSALVVPASALVTLKTGKTAVFITKGAKVYQKVVETGMESGTRVQILKGISMNDSVVVAGNEKLKDSMDVRLPGPGQKGGSKP